MEKNFIDEFIPSKDTRAYLYSIHHEFTDLEKATIVANHIMISYEKKVEWLNSFKEKISDDTLKDRISKALVQIKKDKKYYRKCNTALGAFILCSGRGRSGLESVSESYRREKLVC